MCNLQPPAGDFFVGRPFRDVWPISQDDVIVHLTATSDFDGEQAAPEFLEFLNQLSAMLEVFCLWSSRLHRGTPCVHSGTRNGRRQLRQGE